MSRHAIIGHVGTVDSVPPHASSGEFVTNVLLATSDHRLEHGIGNALRDLQEHGIRPTEIGVDLLLLAALVHAADTRIARATESQDTWTREIRLITPVSELERWNGCSELLATMLSFLTGDIWHLEFVMRTTGFESLTSEPPIDHKPISFDQVSLFSGGLDSLVGAIDALERGCNPLLVSHAAEGATSDAQKTCFDGLKKQYAGRAFARLRVWMNFSEGLVKGIKSESTTRGRSFLFIALAVAAGTGFDGSFMLDVPENGLIALNVPLDMLRLGSLSTRTTHPFYLARWGELLEKLDIAGVIRNPYWNRTKGEMVTACANPNLLKALLPDCMSCASPAKARWQGHGIEHCGYCVPCLIRRGAIEKAWGRGQDPTAYTLADLRAKTLNTSQAEGQQVRSFQLAVARLQSKPDLAKLLIHKPGSLRDEQSRLLELAEVYRRGMEEVGAVLSGVTATPS